MTTAKKLSDSIRVIEAYTLPDGVNFVSVPCADYAALKDLPDAISYECQLYGWTGWDSDRCVAFYKTDRAFAFRVSK